jgi:hypothetical protein
MESLLKTTQSKEIELHFEKKYRRKYKITAFKLRRTFFMVLLIMFIANAIILAAARKDEPVEAVPVFAQTEASTSEIKSSLITSSRKAADTLPTMLTQTSEQNELTKDSYVSLGIPTEASGEFKTYMDYKKITDQSSKQWYLQQLSYTSEDGFRMFNDCYLVAVGTYYSKEIGKKLIITLESGKKIDVIVGDIKMDKHTDKKNQYVPINGNIVEFIVDTSVMNKKVQLLGNVSCLGLEGKIKSIEVKKHD